MDTIDDKAEFKDMDVALDQLGFSAAEKKCALSFVIRLCSYY